MSAIIIEEFNYLENSIHTVYTFYINVNKLNKPIILNKSNLTNKQFIVYDGPDKICQQLELSQRGGTYIYKASTFQAVILINNVNKNILTSTILKSGLAYKSVSINHVKYLVHLSKV